MLASVFVGSFSHGSCKPGPPGEAARDYTHQSVVVTLCMLLTPPFISLGFTVSKYVTGEILTIEMQPWESCDIQTSHLI